MSDGWALKVWSFAQHTARNEEQRREDLPPATQVLSRLIPTPIAIMAAGLFLRWYGTHLEKEWSTMEYGRRLELQTMAATAMQALKDVVDEEPELDTPERKVSLWHKVPLQFMISAMFRVMATVTRLTKADNERARAAWNRAAERDPSFPDRAREAMRRGSSSGGVEVDWETFKPLTG